MRRFNPELDIPDLSGKTFFVTGGTSGLGSEIVTQLAKHHPKAIYFSGRNQAAAEVLIARHPAMPLQFVRMDQTSLEDVSAAATHFAQQSGGRLDVFICNAGIWQLEPSTTKDGYEINFGVNHLSHALLIKKLLPLLKQAEEPRIINLSSSGYRASPLEGIVFDTLRSSQVKCGAWGWTGMNGWFRYGQSKLANLLYAKELARHHPQITTVAVHPGVFSTYLTDSLPWYHRLLLRLATIGEGCDLATAAHNPLWAATTSIDKLKNGFMYISTGKAGLAMLRRKATDRELAKQLWDWTEQEIKDY